MTMSGSLDWSYVGIFRWGVVALGRKMQVSTPDVLFLDTLPQFGTSQTDGCLFEMAFTVI